MATTNTIQLNYSHKQGKITKICDYDEFLLVYIQSDNTEYILYLLENNDHLQENLILDLFVENNEIVRYSVKNWSQCKFEQGEKVMYNNQKTTIEAIQDFEQGAYARIRIQNKLFNVPVYKLQKCTQTS